MKKKISLLGLVLILVLGLATGCSKSDTTQYDQLQMEQYADYMIQNFSRTSKEDIEGFGDMSELELDLTMLNIGIPVTGENVLAMINAWDAGVEECGAFVTRGNYTMSVTNDGPALTTEADFSDRTGTITIAFDEKMNMESLTVSADYTIAEILQKAGLNTVLGMGTTFVVLIFLSFIIWLLKFIPALEKSFRKSPERGSSDGRAATAPAPIPLAAPSGDMELAAVIAAAVAASEGTSPDGFIVRSIKRRKSNKWN